MIEFNATLVAQIIDLFILIIFTVAPLYVIYYLYKLNKRVKVLEEALQNEKKAS